jgi:hypothetical protein
MMSDDIMGPVDALEWELDDASVESEGLGDALPPPRID